MFAYCDNNGFGRQVNVIASSHPFSTDIEPEKQKEVIHPAIVVILHDVYTAALKSTLGNLRERYDNSESVDEQMALYDRIRKLQIQPTMRSTTQTGRISLLEELRLIGCGDEGPVMNISNILPDVYPPIGYILVPQDKIDMSNGSPIINSPFAFELGVMVQKWLKDNNMLTSLRS